MCIIYIRYICRRIFTNILFDLLFLNIYGYLSTGVKLGCTRYTKPGRKVQKCYFDEVFVFVVYVNLERVV